MAKAGSDKNTKNKSKHTKLMNRKKNKIREKEQSHKDRLKALKVEIAKKERRGNG
ncbi:hypothetical protein [Ochrovirga pacifica]|uniref:hypothetical protein n=1 Tax=Ochrovirga pacifica TaxID=1042376 RepID=UPI0002558B2D|nr:hypothetical protein [Ochrovirga pacifica]